MYTTRLQHKFYYKILNPTNQTKSSKSSKQCTNDKSGCAVDLVVFKIVFKFLLFKFCKLLL